MATISEQLRGGVPDFARLPVDSRNPAGAALWVPGKLAKALADEAEARAKVEGTRRRGRKVMEAHARPNFPNGKFFDDIGTMAAYGVDGNGLRKPYGTISFRALRALGNVWIDRLIINARKAQMRRFAQVCDAPGKQLGFRCVHKDYQNVDVDTDTDDIRRRCKEMDDRLKSFTRPVHQSFGDVIENMIEEELVIDRRVIVTPKGRGGKIASYHMIDGEHIRPRLEVLANWMTANRETDYGRAERKIQIGLVSDPPRDPFGRPKMVDFLSAAYVQVLEDRVVDAWREEDIDVAIAHPSIRMNRWGYGTSLLEDSLGLSMLFMRAMRYNQNLFDVNYPEAILVVSGDYDEDGLSAFKKNVFEWDTGEASTRLPVVSGSAEDFKGELLRLRDTPKDMLMTELIRFVCNLKCAAYGMHPSEINVMPDGQGGAVVNVDQSQGDEIAQATERGFHSLAYGQADTLTRILVSGEYDDLMYIIEGLDREGEQGLAAKIESYTAHSTFNELRAMRDQKPLPKGVPVDPGDFVANAEYFQAIQLIQGQAQQQASQDMGGYEQGNFGQPDDNDQQGQGQMGGAPGMAGGAGAPGLAVAGQQPGAAPGPGGGAPGQQPPAPGAGGPPPGRPARAGTPPPGRGKQGRTPGNPLFRSEELAHFYPNGDIDWGGLVEANGHSNGRERDGRERDR